MRKQRHLLLVVAAIFLASLWGCGSSLDSGGDQTGQGTAISNAQKVGSTSCKVCHTAIVAQNWTGSEHDRGDADCEGCHGGGQFHKGIGPIPFPSPGPAQCTVCHSLTTASAISDTHVDDPATATTIEGYVVKTAEQTGCQSCHLAIHNPDLTINNEWANSAHGGHIATGPVTSATADAWVHYNWDSSFKADGTDADSFPDKDRVDCQRCHTATGISNFLSNPAGYDPAKNDFSHLSGWSGNTTGTIATASTWGITTPSGQNELLYCSGCHSDVSRATVAEPNLRNPGSITENYAAVNQAVTTSGSFINTVADTGTAVPVTYPDVGPSNVCLGCHIGREIGANIAAVSSSDGILSFVNSHYLTAGGTVFNTSGYEYAGQTYSNFGFHKNLGVGDPAANFNTGSSGPCVTCHMSVDSGHTFVFVTKDVGGAIEDNNSPICSNCHANMDGGTLEATRENFHLALEELNVALQARGIFFFNAHPYFYQAADGAGGAFTNWESVATTLGVGLAVDPTGTGWKNVMGAAFNYNLFEHDPGAYAHNSDYALKLIADSIDFLDNGAVDASAASLASTLIGQGMNIAGGAGYSPIHGDPAIGFAGGPVAAAVAAPTTSQLVCSVCHPAAPHYGGYPGFLPDGVTYDRNTAKPQWVNNQVVSCAECHADSDPSLNQPILTQYAASGHGDVAGVWIHEEAGGTCSRCHTTSGFIVNLATGSAATPSSFSYGASDPLQTLNCNACHSSIDGEGAATLRAASAYTRTNYTNAVWSQNSVTVNLAYPDAGDSNLCIRCHSARRAGANITPLATTTAHYIPAAAVVYGGTAGLATVTANTVAAPNNIPAVGTVYTGGGYEFTGQTYVGLNNHGGVGGAVRGPCVTCHMSGAAGHTWNPVTKNEVTGQVTALNSSACNTATCHDGTVAPVVTIDFLNTRNANFTAARDLLVAQLALRSIYLDPASGTFYKDSAFTTRLGANATEINAYYATQAALAPAVTTRDLQGAAFNLWLFTYHGADPAGYVHNGPYALKLINDSAEMLGTGVIVP